MNFYLSLLYNKKSRNLGYNETIFIENEGSVFYFILWYGMVTNIMPQMLLIKLNLY